MQEEHAKLLLAKEQALFASQQRKLRQREKLTQDIIEYGLWQISDDISRGLSQLRSNSAKVKAIKAQLDFRKLVLEQTHPEKDVFFLTKIRRKLSVDELVTNLCKLVSRHSHSPKTSMQWNIVSHL